MRFIEVFVFCVAALGSAVLSAGVSGGQDEQLFAVIPPQPASQASEVIIAQIPEQKEVSPGSSIPDSASKLRRSADSNGHLTELNEDVESAPRVARAPQLFGNQLLNAANHLFGNGGGGYNPGYGNGYGNNGGGYPGGGGYSPPYNNGGGYPGGGGYNNGGGYPGGGGYNNGGGYPGGGGYNPNNNGGGYPGGGGYSPPYNNGGGSGSNSYSHSSAESQSLAGGVGLGPLGNIGGTISSSSAQSGAGSNSGGYGRR